jgi:hypothetical protein
MAGCRVCRKYGPPSCRVNALSSSTARLLRPSPQRQPCAFMGDPLQQRAHLLSRRMLTMSLEWAPVPAQGRCQR